MRSLEECKYHQEDFAKDPLPVAPIVLVTGGRDYPDKGRVWSELTKLRPGCVLEGGANGADKHAREWAAKCAVPSFTCWGHFDVMGPPAGPVRNGWMLKFLRPHLVLAFPGNKGTKDMCDQARRAGIEIREIK